MIFFPEGMRGNLENSHTAWGLYCCLRALHAINTDVVYEILRECLEI